MKRVLMIYWLYIFSIFSTVSIAQNGLSSQGEVRFSGCLNPDQFNKVYLLGPNQEVVLKNYCSEEIAIGLRKYFDISNTLALVYQQRDSITIGLIYQYQKIDSLINDLSGGLTTISTKLKNISELNLKPSIDMLEISNDKLKDSNARLDSALGKLKEINFDLSEIQFSNFFKDILYYGGALVAGILIGHYVWKQ